LKQHFHISEIPIVSTKKRSGFTLIELLVVIAIISLLMALLLPAIQRVREASNKLICSNNQRQLVIAQHNHHNDYGYLSSPVDKSGPERSWSIMLLPYIEKDNLKKSYQLDQHWYASVNMPVITQPLKLFVCPSSPAQERVTSGVTDKGKPYTSYIGDYAGVRQVKDSIVVAGIVPIGGDGILGKDIKRKLTDVLDGNSNTIMFGDRAGGPDHYVNGKVVTTPAASNGLGWGARANYIQLEGYLTDGLTSPGPRVMNANNDEFYSFHPGGCNFSFGDASVHFLRADIKATIFSALLTARTGETFSSADWE